MIRARTAPSFTSFRAIFALIMREMATTYGRSPGGYVWAILEPVAAIALFSVIFGFVFDAPPLGTSFGLFFASGFMPLFLYMGLTAKIGQSILYSRPLLAYPRVRYFDAILARAILTFMTQILVGVIIIGMLVIVEDLDLSIDFGALGLAYLLCFFLGLGIGIFNAFMAAMFPIYQTVWAILNRPMFIVSGILYLIDPLPEYYRDILLMNPICHIVMIVREGLYVSYDAVLASSIYVLAWSIVPAVLGLVFLNRYHNDILNK